MNNEEKYIAINLDDYSIPKPIRDGHGYAGTAEDYRRLCKEMDLSVRARMEQNEVLNFLTEVRDSDMHKLVRVKDDEIISRFIPIEMRFHDEQDFLGCGWQYKACNDAIYPMYADRVHLDLAIFQLGDKLYPSIKATVEVLRVCLQGSGWVAMNTECKGFPGMIKNCHDIYEMMLYSVADTIEVQDLDKEIETWKENPKLYLPVICKDIIAEGFMGM